MTSIVTSAAQAAHSAASALLSKAEIKPGESIPASKVKEDDAHDGSPLTLTGKNIIVGVPGAFTGTCSAQIPGYIKKFAQFQEKGITNIYVVAVNDVFVMKGWKENLAPEGTPIHFLADDNAAFISSLGLVFDASGLLGGPRSKRFVLVTEGDKVVSLSVEPNPGAVTTTAADVVLAQL
ncbi:Redoxin [Cyathus striatus]|nr:Redoxin [Cyathus striatus]